MAKCRTSWLKASDLQQQLTSDCGGCLQLAYNRHFAFVFSRHFQLRPRLWRCLMIWGVWSGVVLRCYFAQQFLWNVFPSCFCFCLCSSWNLLISFWDRLRWILWMMMFCFFCPWTVWVSLRQHRCGFCPLHHRRQHHQIQLSLPYNHCQVLILQQIWWIKKTNPVMMMMVMVMVTVMVMIVMVMMVMVMVVLSLPLNPRPSFPLPLLLASTACW